MRCGMKAIIGDRRIVAGLVLIASELRRNHASDVGQQSLLLFRSFRSDIAP